MNFIKTLLYAVLFYCGVLLTKFREAWKPKTKQQHKVKSTKIAYKEGESYRLGECIVTLAKFGPEGKQEVAAKLLAYEAQRQDKENKLTERAEKIMLMTPDEVKEFMVEEWLKKRKEVNEQKLYESLEAK